LPRPLRCTNFKKTGHVRLRHLPCAQRIHQLNCCCRLLTPLVFSRREGALSSYRHCPSRGVCSASRQCEVFSLLQSRAQSFGITRLSGLFDRSESFSGSCN
jgi:hypothetical protein